MDRSGKAISRFDGVAWNTYTSIDGVTDFHATRAGEDKNGIMWFGLITYDGKEARPVSTAHRKIYASWTVYRPISYSPSHRALTVPCGSEHRKDFPVSGTMYGNHIPEIMAPRVISCFPRRWTRTTEMVRHLGGIVQLRRGCMENPHKNRCLAGDLITEIRVDEKNALWTSGPGGLSRYNGSSWQTRTPGTAFRAMGCFDGARP